MNNHSDFHTIFQFLPGNYLILKSDAPNFTIVGASDSYTKVTFTKRESIAGKKLFDIFPDNPGDSNATGKATLIASLNKVITKREPDEILFHKYDLLSNNGASIETRYWNLKNCPVFDDQGKIIYIIHSVVNVTEQIEARRQTERLKLDQKAYDLFMHAPVAIGIIKGEAYIIELANNTFLELIGKSADVISKPLLEALPEIKDQGFIELMAQVRIMGKPYHANEVAATLIRNGKEEIIYVNFVYQPYFEDDGTISGIMIIATEVTEQVSARKKIEESVKRFRNLVEEAPVATAVLIGESMALEVVNDAMIKTWGKNATIIGKTFKEALPELEGQPFHDLLLNVYKTGQMYKATEGKADLVVDGKLQSFYFNFTYSALRNSEGGIYGTLIMAVDVTEQVISKYKLIQSEARLRLAVEAAYLGTYEFDIVNNIIIHSPRLAEIFGHDPSEQLSPETFIKSIHPADISIRNKAYEKATKTGELFYEARIILPDSSIRWIKVNGKHRFENGNAGYSIGTVMDITEEKRSAETLEQKIRERTRELEEANELLKRSNEELEQIANAASHDLKEPLRKIRTFNQMIKKESYDILSERSLKHLDKSSESAERMGAFLDALLEYTELKKADQITTVDLNSTISDVLIDLELVISEKGAIVNIQPLPAIRGIPHQLYQLFYNLLNNSLKFSKPGIPPVIDISADKVGFNYVEQHTTLKLEKEYTEIIVKDNGIGFDEKHAGDIFTIFKRLHNKTAYTGTGIGLALCKKVALNLGGDIFASSLAVGGATFHIILPIEAISQ